MNKIKLCIIYQSDLLANIPSGIDSFIKGIISYAPEDIEISMVGLTTDPIERPVGKWTHVRWVINTLIFCRFSMKKIQACSA